MADNRKQTAIAADHQAAATDVSNSDIEQMYADTSMELGVGPFVSRVIFGNQKFGTSTNIPSFQLVMPTNALVDLALAIVKNFAETDIADQIATTHSHFHSTVKKGTK